MYKRKIWYIGYYDSENCSEKRKSKGNIAGTVYMRGLINSLKREEYCVSVVSLQVTSSPGIYKEEHIVVDEQEEQYLLPYISVKVKNRLVGGKTIIWALKRFIRKNVQKGDIVITYHSLSYKDTFAELRDEIGYTWIAEVNEIYCLSRKDFTDESYLKIETAMFEKADAHIFASDALAKQYANGKKYVVMYGNYDVVIEEKSKKDDMTNLVYTGIINEDRGVYKIIDAMKLLSEHYKLYILGFGSNGELEKLEQIIGLANADAGYEKISYCGTKVGDEYSDFLSDKHIGVSLMSQKEAISNNAFPGKILSYMGHSLYVLSSACDSIMHSKLGRFIHFCNNEPESIAKTIGEISLSSKCDTGKTLGEIQKEFQKELSLFLSEF